MKASITITTLAAGALLFLVGCGLSFEQDPETTVTVEISGITEEGDRQDVQDALNGMADGSRHTMSTTWSGDLMTVRVSPVSDPEAFAEQITFGTVTEVDERTVRVEFAGAPTPEGN